MEKGTNEKLNKKTPLISVVVPVYKTEKYVANTIRSLCNQTFQNFEVIFVDDGSPDNAVQVIEREMQNASVNYSIIRQENSGVGVCRNTGVKNACGDWVLFLDSDDVLQTWALQAYVDEIEKNPDVDFLFSKFQHVTEENIFQEVPKTDNVTYLTKEQLLHGFLTRERTVLVPGALFKVATLKEKDIWHIAIRWSEDQHFMWRVLDNAEKGVFIEDGLYNYLQRSTVGSIMTSTPIDVMLSAYQEFVKLVDTLSNAEVKKYLLSRWVLGCLNVLARRKDKKGWVSFFEAVEGKKHLKILSSFPQGKVRLLARVGRIHKSLLYTATRVLR
ncbi:MAG: glycosyltransferase family 2 protein [Clostridiales bacterium]|nr:glycosyltransferase family 2 protein [Clostridiales bacterium]